MKTQNNVTEVTTAPISTDIITYSKIKGKLPPTTPVTITGDKPPVSTATTMEEQETIQPQDASTIKYLSNVKDAKSGEVSKPFTIGDKRYQMVRGITPTREVVMGVYCHDDLNESGENIIHHVDHFESNIAKPMREKLEIENKPKDVKSKEKKEILTKEDPNQVFHSTNSSIGLSEFKHFIVNNKTGKFRKFKEVSELASAGMGPDEKYMGSKQFRKYFEDKVFGPSKRQGNITEINDDETNTDVVKLKTDVKKLTNLIKSKFSVYLDKIDKPIEQAQFLVSMGEIIGVPKEKLSLIITQFKDIVNTPDPQSMTENKIVIKKIKIKDVK